MSNPINRKRKKISKEADKLLYAMCYKVAERDWPLIQRRDPSVIKICEKIGCNIEILDYGLGGMAEMLVKAVKAKVLKFNVTKYSDGITYTIVDPNQQI